MITNGVTNYVANHWLNRFIDVLNQNSIILINMCWFAKIQQGKVPGTFNEIHLLGLGTKGMEMID